MSDGGIDLQPNIQTQGVVEINLELPVTAPLPSPGSPIPTGGTENGAIYFKLEWQNNQADDRRQQITLDLSGRTTVEQNVTNAVRQTVENSTRESDSVYDTRSVRGNIYDRKTAVADVDSENQSPRLSAKTFLPNEGEIFETQPPFDETFEPYIFENNQQVPNEAGVNDFREAAPENDLFFNRRENSSVFGQTDSNSFTEKSAGKTALPITEDAFIGTEITNTVVSGEVVPERQISKDVEFERDSKGLPGNVSGALLTENGATRSAVSAVSDNTVSVNAAARRTDGGTAMGGALINGALTTHNNYENLESRDINRSRFVGDVGGTGHKSLAAGATGVMMSAAIGSVIPNAETNVGSLLSTITGAVVGVETDQGLRFLGANQPAALPEKSAGSNFSLQTSFA